MTCVTTRVSSLVAPTCSCSPSHFRRARRSGITYVSTRDRQTTRAGGVDDLPKGTPHDWVKVVGPAYDWRGFRRVPASDNWPKGTNRRGSGYVMWFPVDVDENADKYTFVADIPGVEKQNVKVRSRFHQHASHRPVLRKFRASQNKLIVSWS